MALVFKVFTLTIRTAAKPLAGRFERYVVSHPTLRPRVVAFAQALHRLEVIITRGYEGKSTRAFVGQMTEDKALESAGKIASESLIFGVGVFFIWWEYERQAKKEADKKVRESAFQQEMRDRRNEELLRISDINDQQNAILAAISQRVERLEQQLGTSSTSGKLKRSTSSWSFLGS